MESTGSQPPGGSPPAPPQPQPQPQPEPQPQPQPQPEPARARRQGALNAEVWSTGDFLDEYTGIELRPPEAALLDAHPAELAGSVLELGCGGGRVTRHLLERARCVHALDLSPSMIAHCRDSYPRATFDVGDLSDLSRFHAGSFDAVVASFCVLDVLDDEARRRTLDEIRRVLVAGGLLLASSHNLAFAPRIPKPTAFTSRSPARIARMPMRVRNHSRLRHLQRVESDYAVLVDDAHDYSLLHYYIARDAQERQLADHGFALLECLDLDGSPVGPGETAPDCPELHYAARRVD
jgi:SAM-dependent methyltransferase